MVYRSSWHHSRRRIVPLAVLTILVACGLTVFGPAADHRDGPIFINTAVNGQQDINDVYVFTSPATPSNTVFAMAVQPFAGVLTPVTFATHQSFELALDTDGDAEEDITFRVTFSPAKRNGVQEVRLRSHPGSRPHFHAHGKTGENIRVKLHEGKHDGRDDDDDDGKGKNKPAKHVGLFRAAVHDDPFFFDVTAFNSLLNLGPYPRPVGQAKNFFGPASNTLAIILELPTKLVTKPGSSTIGVWGRIIKKGVQVDRMGRPAINTALIPPVPRGSNVMNPKPDRRNAFNAGSPKNDRRDFRADMIDILTNFYGRDAQTAGGLADFLLPDILTFDTAQPGGFPNGRRLRDPVIHVELGLLTGGAITTDNVDDDNGTKITDGTMGTTAAFPYFGPPNSPPGGPNP